MFHEFPKMKYQGSQSITVNDAAEELALEGEWFDTPWDAAAAKVEKPKADELPSKEELVSLATELGVEFDKRWGAAKIAEAIAQHQAKQD